MAVFDFETYDVFTNERFSGNPLAVVMDARGLSGDDMQTITREFNLAETSFVLPPEDPAHTARKEGVKTRRYPAPLLRQPDPGTDSRKS